ncbi:MAG TPA: ABC transporter permease [Candidatus Eisenbacteria bacterium]|nr:ABC transporter permease [Candidatus Eisenbacteria bacterium]
MSLQNIGIVYRKELTEALRDRRTLISSLIVPLVLFPILTAGLGAAISAIVGKVKSEIPQVMILGGADSPKFLEYLRQMKKVQIVPLSPDWKDKIINKEIRAVVEIPPQFASDLESHNVPTLKIDTYEGDLKSSVAAGEIQKQIENFRDDFVRKSLTANHLPESLLKPFEIKQNNVAPPEKVGGAAFGGVIGYMVILLCLTGSMYPAMDLTAGEKERGTMETILSSPVSRTHLVLGKFFMVLTASLVTAALSVISMGVSFWTLEKFHAFDKAGSDAAQMQLQIHFTTVLSIFVMVLPLAVLFAAGVMTVALFAKSYKEAQSYVTPIMFLVIVPAVCAMLPIDLTAKLSLVPILNAALLCKELVTGTYHWNFIAIIFSSTCVYAAIALFLAVKMFQREDVLFRS